MELLNEDLYTYKENLDPKVVSFTFEGFEDQGHVKVNHVDICRGK